MDSTAPFSAPAGSRTAGTRDQYVRHQGYKGQGTSTQVTRATRDEGQGTAGTRDQGGVAGCVAGRGPLLARCPWPPLSLVPCLPCDSSTCPLSLVPRHARYWPRSFFTQAVRMAMSAESCARSEANSSGAWQRPPPATTSSQYSASSASFSAPARSASRWRRVIAASASALWAPIAVPHAAPDPALAAPAPVAAARAPQTRTDPPKTASNGLSGLSRALAWLPVMPSNAHANPGRVAVPRNLPTRPLSLAVPVPRPLPPL